MNQNSYFFPALTLFVASCFVISTEAQAQPRGGSLGGGALQSNESFQVGRTLGDGNDGRTFAKWTQNIKEQGVTTVIASLRRQSGGSGTYVNLRYGNDGTFENGKRVYLKDNRPQSVSWSVGGEKPNGRPLVLNAYDGEVVLDSVEVRYSAGGSGAGITIPPASPFTPGPKPIPRPDGIHNDHDDDDDDHDNDHHGSYQDNDDNQDDSQVVARCRRSYDLRRPQIEISDMRPSGGLFSGKYKLRGSIRGNCIEEAGYYENGRLKEKIQVPLSDRFQRQEFSLSVRSGRDGEVRAFNTRGDEDSVEIDRQIQSDSSSQGNPFQF